MHILLSTLILSAITLIATLLAAPVPVPVSIAAPHKHSLHAPAHAHLARFIVLPGMGVPEGCDDGDGGEVKCK